MQGDDEDRRTFRTTFDTSDQDPVFNLVETVATLEGVPIEALPSTHETIDGVTDRLYMTPPAPEAQIIVEFTYAGYRVRMHQDGTATFLKIEDGAGGPPA